MLAISGTKIILTRGDSAALTVILKDEAGTQIDLVTGDTIYFTVKTSPGVEAKVFQKTITVFTSGKANIPIVPADTAELSFGNYKYDIQYVRGTDGFVKTIVAPSTFVVAEEVTYE